MDKMITKLNNVVWLLTCMPVTSLISYCIINRGYWSGRKSVRVKVRARVRARVRVGLGSG